MENKHKRSFLSGSSGSGSGAKDFEKSQLKCLEEITQILEDYSLRLEEINKIFNQIENNPIKLEYTKNDIFIYNKIFLKFYSNNLMYLNLLTFNSKEQFRARKTETNSLKFLKFFCYYYSFVYDFVKMKNENVDVLYGCLCFHPKFLQKNCLALFYKLFDFDIITMPHVEIILQFLVKFHLNKDDNYVIFKQLYSLLKKIFEQAGTKRPDDKSQLNGILITMIKNIEHYTNSDFNLYYTFSKTKNILFLLTYLRFDYITDETRQYLLNFLVRLFANRVSKRKLYYFYHLMRNILTGPEKKQLNVFKENLVLFKNLFSFFKQITEKEIEVYKSYEIKEGFVFNDTNIKSGFKISTISISLKSELSILFSFKFFGFSRNEKDCTIFSIKHKNTLTQGQAGLPQYLNFFSLNIEKDHILSFTLDKPNSVNKFGDKIQTNKVYRIYISINPSILMKDKISISLMDFENNIVQNNKNKLPKELSNFSFEVSLPKFKSSDYVIFVGHDIFVTSNDESNIYNNNNNKPIKHFRGIIGDMIFFDKSFDETINNVLLFDKDYHLIPYLNDVDNYKEYQNVFIASRMIEGLMFLNKKITQKKDKCCHNFILFTIKAKHIKQAFKKYSKTEFSSHFDSSNKNNKFKYTFYIPPNPSNLATYVYLNKDIREHFISYNGVSLILLIMEYCSNFIIEHDYEVEPEIVLKM